MLTNEGHRLKRVVVSSPLSEYFKVKDLRSQNILEVAEPGPTLRQHGLLKKLLRDFGAEVLDVEELAGHPNSVFTRDASLITPQGYIHLRMGLGARREEADWMAGILSGLDVPLAGRIEAPGTVEGGDVILAGTTAFIGLSARSNRSGVDQLGTLLKGMGYSLRILPIPSPYLHIGSLMSIIGPEAVCCARGFFPPDFFSGFDTVEVDCRTPVTCNIICLGNNELIAVSGNLEAADALDQKGYRVHLPDLSEFVKGDGGPTCLILPLERTG
jgi:dimethylargininase